MYLDDGKSYLLFGKQINQIIMVLQIHLVLNQVIPQAVLID